MRRTNEPTTDPDTIDEPALTRLEWNRLHGGDTDLVEIVRFHQQHPALLVA